MTPKEQTASEKLGHVFLNVRFRLEENNSLGNTVGVQCFEW